MSDPGFIAAHLATLRSKFYANKPDKQFFQERERLMTAISFPANHLKQRFGVKAPDSVYSNALKTVTAAILANAKLAKIECFSVFFLHCVQEHMKHHGEEYYEAAKASLRLIEQLPGVMRQVRVGETERTADVLIELHRTLRSRGGRKKKQPAASQPSLL